MNLDASDSQKNIVKERPKIPLAKQYHEYKEDPLEDEFAKELVLRKKESSVQIETKIPYSDIPCIKCKGNGEKKTGAPCSKCDGSGRMKNSKKLRKIEYLINKKLNALLSELESANYKKEFLSIILYFKNVIFGR